MIQWLNLHHSELTTAQLYALLKLRCAVFVLEQHCLYEELDGEDLVGENRHILAIEGDEIVAYARILKSEDPLEPIVIGRVIVSSRLRGQKLGEQLMTTARGLSAALADKAIYLGAQAHLTHFYARRVSMP